MLTNQLYNLFNPWRPTNNYTHIYMGIYTHTQTHTLIIRQRWEVKRGGQGHSLFLGWEESIKFSLPPHSFLQLTPLDALKHNYCPPNEPAQKLRRPTQSHSRYPNDTGLKFSGCSWLRTGQTPCPKALATTLASPSYPTGEEPCWGLEAP